MKFTQFKTVGQTIWAILTLTILTQGVAYAQKDDDPLPLEGAWNVQVTRINCQTSAAIDTAPAMLTFMRGGTMIDVGTRIPSALRATGQGFWRHDSGGHYTADFQFFRFNPDGTLAGRQIVRQQIDLNRAATSFSVYATAQVLDINGKIIANNCSKGEAARFE
jgi:hypothetical protein